jgi:hypothetical protein
VPIPGLRETRTPLSAVVSVWKDKDANSLLRQDEPGRIFYRAEESCVGEMYEGFEITLLKDFLDVTSWCWNVDGSGQHHLITSGGSILVDEGFA